MSSANANGPPTWADQLFQQSYSDSVPATGATAGIPGSWTPAGTLAPASVVELAQGVPNAVVANPATAWTAGQFVQTREAGAAGRATWSGLTWVGGVAPGEDPETTEEVTP